MGFLNRRERGERLWRDGDLSLELVFAGKAWLLCFLERSKHDRSRFAWNVEGSSTGDEGFEVMLTVKMSNLFEIPPGSLMFCYNRERSLEFGMSASHWPVFGTSRHGKHE